MIAKPTHPELLARVDATNLSDREVERKVGLPQAFIGKGRKGGNASTKAEPSWTKLRAWLDREFPAPRASVVSSTTSIGSAAVIAELQELVEAADTIEKLEAVGRRVTQEILSGEIDRSVGPMLTNQLREQRMLLQALAEEKNRAAGARPIRVEVVWLSDWRSQAAKGDDDEQQDGAIADMSASNAEAQPTSPV